MSNVGDSDPCHDALVVYPTSSTINCEVGPWLICTIISAICLHTQWIMYCIAGPWLVMLLFITALSSICVHGQLDSHGTPNAAYAESMIFCQYFLPSGFISIDCGYTANPTYTDSKTGISYASDEGYTDAGLIHPVEKGNLQPDLADRYLNFRFFPSGERNCYTLRSLTPGGSELQKTTTFELRVAENTLLRFCCRKH